MTLQLTVAVTFFIMRFIINMNTSKDFFDEINISSCHKLLFIDRTGMVPASQI